MNNNKVFETNEMYYKQLPMTLTPKDRTTKCRVARVGAGVVVLPDNGNPISAKEIVKALGLKNVEPEAKEEKRIKYIMRNNYDSGVVYYISLTESQAKLLEWLECEGIFTEDYTIECAGKMEFEEI